MSTQINYISNRELASLFWIIAFSMWMLRKPEVRHSLASLCSTAFQLKILAPYLLMLGYISLVLYVLAKVKLWDVSLLKDALLWAFGAAIVLYVNATQALKDESSFNRTVRDVLAVTLVIEFLVNLYVFPFWVEFLTLPVIGILVAVSVFSMREQKNKDVKKLADWLLASYGIVVLGLSIKKLISEFTEVITGENLRAFILAPILTVSLLPYLYGLALYASYETLLVRLRSFIKDPDIFIYARRRILCKFHFNLWALNRYSKSGGIVHFESREDVDQEFGF